MTQAFLIKDKQYNCRLVQGPLAGISCAPFRSLIFTCAFSYTEMISCKTLIHASKKLQRRFITKDPSEKAVCFQLSSNDVNELGLATKIVSDYGADLIDLNCGCPVKKVRSKKSGSHLLSQASTLYHLICAMKNNTTLPVSIKIRVDANSDDRFNQDIANAVSDAGADFITVHGRHWTHGYDVNCFYDDISFFVNALKIPVIGNGDIACIDSLRRMLDTGCAGAMIGRAGVGQPWLIEQLMAKLEEKPYIIPSHSEIGLLLSKHLNGLCALLGSEKLALLQGRTFVKYYARTLPNKFDFCESFQKCDEMNAAEQVIKKYFNAHIPSRYYKLNRSNTADFPSNESV